MSNKNNDYQYSSKEKVMIKEIRDGLVTLTDRANTEDIKRADLICTLGALQSRIGKLNKVLNEY